MRRGRLAVGAAIFLLARGSAEAMPICQPQPDGIDPAYGNFTPTNWVEGNLRWMNNAVGASFFGLWANTDFDMWFVGFVTYQGAPIAVHFDGFSLQPMQIAGTSWLQSVWGSAADDVWAVGGNGLIVHWDGTQWVTVPSTTAENLYAISGTASDDIWAGGNKVMLHWDGNSWTNSPGFVPDIYDRLQASGLAAISRDDALIATAQGCQRWDGTSWHRTDCGVIGSTGVFATSSNDIWVVGVTSPGCCADDTSYRAHWDGSSWTTTVVYGRTWTSIGGTGPSDIWIDGRLHYDGASWTEMPCGPQFNAISVTNNGAIIGVNGLGIEYFSGEDGWPFLARTYVPWNALGGRDPADIWAVDGYGAVIHYDGSRWSGQNFRLPPANDFVWSAFGSSSSDIWGTSVYGLKHFDGKGWTTVDFPGGQIRTGFARAPNDAIAVDEQNRPWHWDGSRWSAITLPIFGGFPIGQFWGTAPDDVWAVGGAVFHWDGDSWQRVWAGSQGWVSFVGGSARDDAWFAIRQRDLRTTVLHWDGSSFTELDTFDRLPGAITSTGPTDVWLILIGEVRHYDGVNWNVEPIDWYLLKVLGVRGAGAFLATWHGHIYQSR